jgi:hypothetical protein
VQRSVQNLRLSWARQFGGYVAAVATNRLWIAKGARKRTACRIDRVCKAVITAFEVVDFCRGKTKVPAYTERLTACFRHHQPMVLEIDCVCDAYHGLHYAAEAGG